MLVAPSTGSEKLDVSNRCYSDERLKLNAVWIGRLIDSDRVLIHVRDEALRIRLHVDNARNPSRDDEACAFMTWEGRNVHRASLDGCASLRGIDERRHLGMHGPHEFEQVENLCITHDFVGPEQSVRNQILQTLGLAG